MSWRQRVLCSSTGLVLALAGNLAQAGPYSSMYVFGDSLSDVGNDAAITGGAVPLDTIFTNGSVSGRFTNGANYVDDLAGYLGLSVAPSFLGGTGYAYGGARIDSIGVPGGLSFNNQVKAYFASHPGGADPNALYVVWIGANNMSDAIAATLGGDAAAIGTQTSATVGAIGAAIGSLAASGARHFLVPNLPDLSLTPAIRFAHSAALSGLARGVSSGFNTALAGVLNDPAFGALDIDLVDVFSAQNFITQNPALYGFTNVSDACYTGEPDGSPRLGWGTPGLCADPTGYMYFDYQHPTAQLHTEVARLAFATLEVPEPTALSLLFAGLGMLAFARRRARRD